MGGHLSIGLGLATSAALCLSAVAGCNAVLGNDAVALWDGSPGASADSEVAPPSCVPGGPGTNDCGDGGESCCASLEVEGGSYDRTYDPQGPDGGVEIGPDGAAVGSGDPATVSGFRLDEYEVTVGRFRQFVGAWTHGWLPEAGAGTHAYLRGGAGLANGSPAGGSESGWLPSDDADVQPTDANLSAPACDGFATWTTQAGAQEDLPINCVNWYEAYAFCIWDRGFLPTEAEWEYAAAGGPRQREYPWGATPPGTASQYAVLGNGSGECDYPTPAACMGVENVAPVGRARRGAGAWGQLDLAGNVWEWTLDAHADYVSCVDCAYLPAAATSSPAVPRVVRGGDFYLGVSFLVPSYRGSNPASYRGNDIGVRCARAP